MSEIKQENFDLKALHLGDRQEFARVVEAYSGVIYRLALRLVSNPQDAEDVLQEAFMKAYQALPNFDGRSSLSTWLYRIATNEALMLLRRQKKVEVSIEEPQEDGGEDQEALEIVDLRNLPEEEMVTAETRQVMDKAIDTLPASLKAVFLLREQEGLSTQETAQALSLSETAVKTRLSRARLRLRGLLSSYFGERLYSPGSYTEEIVPGSEGAP